LVFSALFPKITGAKIFLDIHDVMPEFFASKIDHQMSSFMVRLVILQERLSCWFADHVITVTEVWRERLTGRGVNSEKVSVVMNVADHRYFHSNYSDVNSTVNDENFNLFYHGAFKEKYGMGDLIHSIGLAREKIPNIHLTLQGFGDYYPEMMNLVDQLDLHKEVSINKFTLPANELPALINKANMGVVPNQNDIFNGDLLPTKMLEYIALDKPVIAARTRVISHYFDETMVQFFDPGNPESLAEKIVYSYQNWDEVVGMKKNYSSFTSKYNWKLLSKMYVELVREFARSVN
jgi:glycosyltransferase involved in cell wall biosynthesis